MGRQQTTLVVANATQVLQHSNCDGGNLVVLDETLGNAIAVLPSNPYDGEEVTIKRISNAANVARVDANVAPAGCTIIGAGNLTIAAIHHSYILRFRVVTLATGVGVWDIKADYAPS